MLAHDGAANECRGDKPSFVVWTHQMRWIGVRTEMLTERSPSDDARRHTAGDLLFFLSRRRRARLPDGDARSSANTGPRIPARPRIIAPGSRDLRHPRFRGQAMVEFALVVPLFMLLLLLAVDFGRLFFSYVQINNAAREAAAYAATARPTTRRSSPRRDSRRTRRRSAVKVPSPLRPAVSTRPGQPSPARRRRREPARGARSRSWPARTSRS